MSGPEALRIAKQSEHLGLDRKKIFEPFVQTTGVPIFSVEGREHELLRRLVRYGYTRGTIAPFVSRISDTVREIISEWPADVILQPRMEELSIRAMAATVSPEPIPLDFIELGEVGELGMMVTVRQRSRYVLGLPRMKRSRRNTVAALDPIIGRHRGGLTRDDPLPWMIDAFIAAEADGQKMDDAGIRGGIVYALIAAYIYLGRQSLLMLAEAVRDPRTLSALNKEVDTAFSKGPLTAATLRVMPTLRALFLEANRRYPLLPGMPYETTRTTQVGDFTIGPHELLLLTAVPGHFDGQNYSCPWNFDLNRVRAPRYEHRASGGFAPWGFSPRSCLAIGLCELMTTTMVATMLHIFDLTIPNKSESIPITVAPLVGPSHGQPASLRLRDEADRVIDPKSLYEERLDVHDDDEDLELPRFTSLSLQAGEVIYSPGDKATDFFILVEGRVNVSRESDVGDDWEIIAYGPGQGFGEIGILKEVPRKETATTVDPSELLVLDRRTFLGLLAELDAEALSLAMLIKNLLVSKLLRRAVGGLLRQDLPNISEVSFERIESGKWILREGDASDVAYIIVSGKVDVTCRKGDEDALLATLEAGDIFGEIGVLEKRPRTSSVKTTEPTVLARLTAQMLQELMRQPGAGASGLKLLIARRLIRSAEKLRE
ncbi:cytochrome P450 [Planctomycetaceae bacterium SH139]